jgi:hypothetical protein
VSFVVRRQKGERHMSAETVVKAMIEKRVKDGKSAPTM